MGLAGILWVFCRMVKMVRQGLEAEPWVRVLSIGLLGMLVALIVHGMIDVPYFKNDQALAFWVILGVHFGASGSHAHD